MTKYNYKIYVFDVVYELSRVDSECLLDRVYERVKICTYHSKYAYAKCTTYLFKAYPHLKGIISVELLYSEPFN